MATVIPPGKRVTAAAQAGDAPAFVEAAYDLGQAAAYHAVRAHGEIPALWPGALEVANAKVDEILTRFRIGQPDQELPVNPASYLFASIRRAVTEYLAATTVAEVPEAEADDDDSGDVDLAPELMRALIAGDDHEAARVLAVARDLAEQRVRPTAGAIYAELVRRHAGCGSHEQPARWRVEKAWSRVRRAARGL